VQTHYFEIQSVIKKIFVILILPLQIRTTRVQSFGIDNVLSIGF